LTRSALQLLVPPPLNVTMLPVPQVARHASLPQSMLALVQAFSPVQYTSQG
jgi:hypothetical protein